MFGETHAIKIILDEVDEKKLEALNNAYPVILAFMVCPSKWPRRWPKSIRFSSGDLSGKGEKLALVPFYLGSLFFRSDECVKNIVRSVGRYHVVSHADTAFIQVFLWELFGTLSKPHSF